ncbi:MAG: hypothetical protein IKE43_03790 [Coriobacteriales bacterium]|nr:hypothetical protein [Coriobacteriales bacterium]
MAIIFPITALSKEPQTIKDEALNNIVHITENGRGAWIFTSEKAFEDRIAQERAEAAQEAQLAFILDRAKHDIETGHYVTSRKEMFEEVERRKAASCAV